MRPSIIARGPAERLLREGLRRRLAERGYAGPELDREVNALLERRIDIELEPEPAAQDHPRR